MPPADSDSSFPVPDRSPAPPVPWKPLTFIVAAFGTVNIIALLTLWPYLADKAEKRAALEAQAAARQEVASTISQRLAAFDEMARQGAADAERLRKTSAELQYALGRLDEKMKDREANLRRLEAEQETKLKAVAATAAAMEADYRAHTRTSMISDLQVLTSRADELEQQLAVLEKGVPEQQLREIAEKLRQEKAVPPPPAPGPALPPPSRP